MARLRKPSRELIEKYFPNNHEMIRQYELLFDNGTSNEQIILNIISAIGLDPNGDYIQPAGTRFIDNTNTVMEALDKLDEEINSQTIATITGSTGLLPFNQLIICDATSASIVITLPNPVLCFNNNQSKTISVTKKDTSSNFINILPFGNELIVGENKQDLQLDGELLTFITDGKNWYLGG